MYVAVVPPNTAAITYVTPLVTYLGEYPVAPLEDGAHGGFQVNVTAHLWAPAAGVAGQLVVTSEWGAHASAAAVLPQGDSTVSVKLSATAAQIRLWWPNGVGAAVQPLYNVTVAWVSKQGGVSATTTRRLGFRVPALVTANDTDPAVRADTDAEGSGTHGMFFRVNGAPLYARGGNVVPMEQLEGRMDPLAYATLARSTADAGMNMLRIWGGGIYLPEVFYDTCDERGVLLYHDMQFAGNGHFAENVPHPTIVAEITHQVRRLAHHPSIILYDGANEVVVNNTGPTTVYPDVVLATAAREDPTRIVWPASPAAGWVSGVNRLYGTPNGRPLVALVLAHPHIWDNGHEQHGPYTAGVAVGFPTVCSDPWSQAPTYGPNMPVGYLNPASRGGVAANSTFASEFGVTAMSSFESMAATLAPEHWSIHGGAPGDTCETKIMLRHCDGGNVMAQRNWACDNVIWSMFGPALLNATASEHTFKAQLFQCLVGQALTLKQNMDSRRAGNQLGHIIWQLNEVWPTGGWGSLEYGTVGFTAGQVVGGRWKPLHYWLKAAIFADVYATCGYVGRGHNNATCYVSNNRAGLPFQGTVTLRTIELAGDGTAIVLTQQPVTIAPGPGAMAWFQPPNSSLPNGTTTALTATVTDASGAIVSEHMIQLTAPVNLQAPRANVTATVAGAANPDGTIDITVTASRVALFVTLTSLAQGRFSDNCFLLPATSRTIQFIPFRSGAATADLAALKASLRVEDHSLYASPSP